jgi:steroid delta-isomerase-like uncharacterized protein
MTHASGIDRHALESLLLAARDGFNRHDADAFTAAMTTDVVLHHSALPEPVVGRDAVKRAYAETFWAAFPDQELTLVDGPFLHSTEPRAVIKWSVRGTHLGVLNPPGLHPTGRTAEFVVCDFIQLRDGQICRFDVTVDVADILRQLGVLPPSGSRLERVLMRMDQAKNLPRRGVRQSG